MRRRGLALLVVVGILGVLMLLAVAFVAMARLERKASQGRTNATRALFLARSGIEDALARIHAGQDPSLLASRYGGEDADLSGGALDADERAQETFRIGVADGDLCPVRGALRPSFFVADRATGRPGRVAVGGRMKGYSGCLSGDHAPLGNVYALKVVDESGKINVNGGFLDGLNRDNDGSLDYRDTCVRAHPVPGANDPTDTGRGWNAQLARVLNNLGDLPELSISALGDKVLQNRPLGGYTSIAQLQTRLGLKTPLLFLEPYLTVSSWTDMEVIHPNAFLENTPWQFPPQGSPVAPPTPARNEVKKGRRPLVLEENGRPPVNLNAASRPVLIALLQDLRGVSYVQSTAGWGGGGATLEAAPGLYTIDLSLASRVADALIAARASSPFSSWSQFSAFVDGLVASGVIQGFNHPVGTVFGSGDIASFGGNLAAADLLKANFDPNTMLMKNLPDQLLFRWVDKSDLVQWSTEGCFQSTGTFTISCTGRVLDPQGALLAETSLQERVKTFSLLRQTTQRDFVGGRTPQDGPGSYLSLSTDPLNPATGARASWNTFKPGTGLAAMTYPCPPPALPANAADFDGFVSLATLEEDAEAPAGGTRTFLHHFDDGWTADLGAAPDLAPSGKSWSRLQLDVGTSLWPDQPGLEPNTLCPDGIHLQYDRSPGYPAQGNLPPATLGNDPDVTDDDGNPISLPFNHFSVSYWIKNFGQPPLSPRYDVSVVRQKDDLGTQAFITGRYSERTLTRGWGLFMESGDAGEDGSQRATKVDTIYSPAGDLLPDLRWHLVTVLVNTWELNRKRDVVMDVRGLDIPPAPVSSFIYQSAFSHDRSKALLAPGVLLVLGSNQEPQAGGEWSCTASDQVLDEFSICDLGTDGAAGVMNLKQWASRRWTRGRYYKQDDASFLSTVLAPGGTLLRAWWTEYRPCESRQEIVLPQDFSVPALGQSRIIDHSLDNARLELSLLNASGTPLQTLGQGAPIGRPLDRFRYRVTFKNGLSDPLNQGILETPVFDDITFLWQPAGGPRVLSWGRS